jgi:dihydroorotate dehydrogenase electron transfer subunit
MVENEKAGKKGEYEACVRENRRMGERFYKLKLEFSGEGARAFGAFRAGQFAELDVSATALPPAEKIPEELRDASGRKVLLRRPFSFTDVISDGDRTHAELLYCVVGPSTLRMTTLRGGDTLSIIGPLGNGFWIPEGKRVALLVAGGMGSPPVQCLAKVLANDYPKITAVAFAGAKTAEDLPFEGRMDEVSQHLGFSLREFGRHGIESLVATDDGSAGFAGLVTDCMLQWLRENSSPRKEMVIFACGPEAMLARAAAIAKDKGIDCEVSMERRMACGTGLCQSCAIECRVEGSNETVYKLCCKDGPVFDAKEVVF